jgi:hypothetical protein
MPQVPYETPVNNAERYRHDGIDRIPGQSFKDVEWTVCDAIRLAFQTASDRRVLKESERVRIATKPNRDDAYADRRWVEWPLRQGNMETSRRYTWMVNCVVPGLPPAWRSRTRARIAGPVDGSAHGFEPLFKGVTD